MKIEQVEAEALDRLIDAVQHARPGREGEAWAAERGLVRIVRDLDALGSSPPAAFVAGLEERLRRAADRRAEGGQDGPTRRTGEGRADRLPRWSRAWPARAAAVALMTLGLVMGLTALPGVRAQIGRVACFVPGLGIQTCDAPGLVVARPLSQSRDGATLTVTQLLSASGETIVKLEITGLPLTPDLREEDVESARLRLHDETGREYPARRHFHHGGPTHFHGSSGDPLPGSTQTFRADWTFDGLDPAVRTVELTVAGPPPVDTWTVRVPVVPAREAGLTFATAGSSAETHQGITVGVRNVTSDAERTVVQLTASAQSPWQRVINIGGDNSPLDVAWHGPTLRDGQGREYARRYVPVGDLGSRPPDASGAVMQERVFEPLASNVRRAELTVPFVTVLEETPETRLTVSTAGMSVGSRRPLQHTISVGRHTVEITAIELDELFGRRELVVHFDLGDWQNGEKPVAPSVRLEGVPILGMTIYPGGGDVGQQRKMALALPDGATDEVTLVFKGMSVAVAGPWRLEIAGPAAR